MTIVRAAGSILIAMSLAGCAGGLLGGSAAPDTGMAGRWMLAVPNAPICGMNFAGAPARARALCRRKAAVRRNSL